MDVPALGTDVAMATSGTIMHVSDVGKSLQKFGLTDYVVFVLMLVMCACIGVYFWFIQRRSTSSADYLVGGRSMSVFPVAMSLIASFISGISLLGTPTEIYVYGVQYMYIVGAILLTGVTMGSLYLPVFHDLKVTSTYEYLETRFDKRLRLFGSILFTFGTITWLPIVIYVPALAFNQVTGINVHIITPLVCLVCIFYTCVGGLRAVVWTDLVQTLVMLGAMILVIVKGTMDLGGWNVVWERALHSGRIEAPDWDLNPKSRHTVWSLLFGGFAVWLQHNAVSQNMIQRYLALPTLKAARRALWIFIFGVLLLIGLCCYSGLLIYATYHDCDPLTTKLARSRDQLLPLLVMDILGELPGLPGLFVAGVFSAALSSLSTGLNSMAAVVLEDFYKPFFGRPLSERATGYLMRTVVGVLGVLCVGLVFVVEHLGGVLQLSISLGAVTNGPLLGLFTMGILLPWVNSRGAFAGGISGLSFMTWVCLRAQAAIASGELRFTEKRVTTEGCSYSFPPPALSQVRDDSLDSEFSLHHISYLWYSLVGAIITISVGLVVSFCLGANDPRDVSPSLLAPPIRHFWPQRPSLSRQPGDHDILMAFEEPIKIDITPKTNIQLKNVNIPVVA